MQKLGSSSTYSHMNFNLIQDKTFPLQSGVASLGPQSQFWVDMEQIYQKPEGTPFLETSFYYAFDGTDPMSKDAYNGSMFIFNGRSGATQPAMQNFSNSTFFNESNAFVFEGANLNIGDTNLTGVSICVLNDMPGLVAFNTADYTKYSKTIMDKLCPSAKGDWTKCIPNDADFSYDNAPVIRFGFKDGMDDKELFGIDYSSNEYTFLSGGDKSKPVVTGILDQKDVPQFSNCGSAQVAVGRFFLMNSEFVVRKYGKDDAYSLFIGFNETKQAKNKTMLMILVLLGIFIVAVMIALIFLKTCKRTDNKQKETADEEDYQLAKQA
jgi:hypothetical protein